jgi:pyruvate formate lyase activating enzyme
MNSGTKMSANEIIARYKGVKEFCKGGITVTGGEPLMQIDFVTELFKLAKKNNIHTALDTSGITFTIENIKKIELLIEYTDIVLLDVKHINDDEHKKLTSHSNKSILEFAKYLYDKQKPMWVRHVVVPEITYNKEYLFELGKFLKGLKNITALDILPYHSMAISKYKKLGMEYPLSHVPQLTKEQALQARNWIMEGFKYNA